MITAKIEGVACAFDPETGWKDTENPGSNLEKDLNRLWGVHLGLDGYEPDPDMAHVRAVIKMLGGDVVSRTEEPDDPDEHDEEVVY